MDGQLYTNRRTPRSITAVVDQRDVKNGTIVILDKYFQILWSDELRFTMGGSPGDVSEESVM